jgi:hypothetical protein
VHTLVRDSMKDRRAAEALQRLASDLIIAEVATPSAMSTLTQAS